MSLRPLDLQVNMNAVMETSRDQGLKMANMLQEQRVIDQDIIEDAKNREKMVNKAEKADSGEKLEDSEKHFGNKTAAETEQEFAGEEKEEKPGEPTPTQEKKKPGSSPEHHIDVLV